MTLPSISYPKLNLSCGEATECLTSDPSIISEWSRANHVLMSSSKLNFFIYPLDTTFLTTIPFLMILNYHLSSTLNIFELSFDKNLNWKFYIAYQNKVHGVQCSVLPLLMFFLLVAYIIQGPYPSMYEVLLPHMEASNSAHTALLN